MRRASKPLRTTRLSTIPVEGPSPKPAALRKVRAQRVLKNPLPTSSRRSSSRAPHEFASTTRVKTTADNAPVDHSGRGAVAAARRAARSACAASADNPSLSSADYSGVTAALQPRPPLSAGRSLAACTNAWPTPPSTWSALFLPPISPLARDLRAARSPETRPCRTLQKLARDTVGHGASFPLVGQRVAALSIELVPRRFLACRPSRSAL